MPTPDPDDAFHVLGLPADAGEELVRARYLELVRKHPPEHDPERFRQIRAAYESAKDPLKIAAKLIEPPAEAAPDWLTVIEEESRTPPPLQVDFLLSLGNGGGTRDKEPNEGQE